MFEVTAIRRSQHLASRKYPLLFFYKHKLFLKIKGTHLVDHLLIWIFKELLVMGFSKYLIINERIRSLWRASPNSIGVTRHNLKLLHQSLILALDFFL